MLQFVINGKPCQMIGRGTWEERVPEEPGRGLRRYCLSPPRCAVPRPKPTPLPEGNWLAPKLRTLLERLETLSVGPSKALDMAKPGPELGG